MLRGFLRFFIVLIVVECVTIAVTMLLLDRGIYHWTDSKAQELVKLAPAVASEFASSELTRLKVGDTHSSEYRACLDKLTQLEKSHYPYGGCTFALFRVLQGKQGPWLLMLAGESPPYALPTDEKEPDAPVSPAVRGAAEGQVTYTAVPYGGFGYDYVLTAYAPVRKADGRLQAVLAVDYDVSSLNDLRDVVRTAFLWAVLPATLLSAIVAYFLALKFVDPIEFLGRVHAAMPQRGRPGASEVQVEQLISAPPDVPAAVPVVVDEVISEMDDASPPSSPTVQQAESLPEANTPIKREDTDDHWRTLTVREREVVLCLGQGLTNKKMAEQLFVSEETIKKHLKNIFPKLGAKNRTEAALYAIGKGAMSWSPPKSNGEDDRGS